MFRSVQDSKQESKFYVKVDFASGVKEGVVCEHPLALNLSSSAECPILRLTLKSAPLNTQAPLARTKSMDMGLLLGSAAAASPVERTASPPRVRSGTDQPTSLSAILAGTASLPLAWFGLMVIMCRS